MDDTNAQWNNPNELAMRNAAEELRVRLLRSPESSMVTSIQQRRRERGRLSQARFRERKALASQEMQEENEKMKAAITEVVKATQRGDRPSLLRAVRAAADTAGVDASGLDDENWQRGAGAAKESDIREEDDVTRAWAGNGGDLVTTPPPPTSGSRPTYPASHRGDELLSSCVTSTASGTFSPRLDYGIWVDARRAVGMSGPPTGILPFLGAGRYTFAGQLYWACTDYLISLCRLVAESSLPSPWFDDGADARPNPSEAEVYMGELLQHSPYLRNRRFAQAMAEAQREYRDAGYYPSGGCASNAEDAMLSRREVGLSYAPHGRDMNAWMTIADLEEHMRRQLGGEAFSRLERAISSHNTIRFANDTAEPNPDVQAIVKLLVRNLAKSYSCFGDGPRWRADRISLLFTEHIQA
ncbi:hypothetical protein F4802DRAFT_598627 [Xylaria palmicola]|nr:hypothetical protein F4802DRAFT_598627 [Xylaria palmicola]